MYIGVGHLLPGHADPRGPLKIKEEYAQSPAGCAVRRVGLSVAPKRILLCGLGVGSLSIAPRC